MEDNFASPKPPGAWRTTVREWLVYLKKVLLMSAVVAAVTGASFLVTGGLTAKSYSDRLFMGGVLVTFAGVFIFISFGGTRKNLGFGSIAKKPEEAKKLMEHSLELIEKSEKRYDAGSQVWVVGLACMVLSVLLYLILSAFGI